MSHFQTCITGALTVMTVYNTYHITATAHCSIFTELRHDKQSNYVQ